MIPSQEILPVAKCFLGRELSPEQELVLETLCQNAAEHWAERLVDKTPEDCRGLFLTACAWTALADFTAGLAHTASLPDSFTIGNFSVRGGAGQTANAAQLRAQAEALMAPCTTDMGFALMGVDG